MSEGSGEERLLGCRLLGWQGKRRARDCAPYPLRKAVGDLPAKYAKGAKGGAEERRAVGRRTRDQRSESRGQLSVTGKQRAWMRELQNIEH